MYGLRKWSLNVMPRKRHRDRYLYILEYKTKNDTYENKVISHLWEAFSSLESIFFTIIMAFIYLQNNKCLTSHSNGGS